MVIDFSPQWDSMLKDDPKKLTVREQITKLVESAPEEELMARNDVDRDGGSETFVLKTAGYEATCRLNDGFVRVERVVKTR